jgi:phenylacetic acid degradation operon negative regulatory protein
MAPFAINERLVRTSVYRLAREGWLVARQSGRRSLYRLTAQGGRKFEHAHRRIYASPCDRWDGEWEMIIAPPAELRASERAALRRELGWEGFGSLGPGVFIRPARGAQDVTVAETVASLAVAHRVWRLDGARPRTHDYRTGPETVRACWNLTRVRAEYAAFIRRFAPLLRALDDGVPIPEQAFVVRTLLIHAFRRASLHDPHLPAQLLPRAWPGAEAYALCRELYRRTRRKAEIHLAAMLRGPHSSLPPVAPYFFERFGGLGD